MDPPCVEGDGGEDLTPWGGAQGGPYYRWANDWGNSSRCAFALVPRNSAGRMQHIAERLVAAVAERGRAGLRSGSGLMHRAALRQHRGVTVGG